MRRYLFLTLLLSCLTLMGWAERIDQEVAHKIAQTVVNGYSQGKLRSSSRQLSLVYAAATGVEGMTLRSATDLKEADYYVFNVAADGGFVIVSGDDRVYPVLGYSDKGRFDPDNIPINLRGMLAYYQKEIDYAVSENLEATDAIRSEWNRLSSGLSLRSTTDPVLLSTANWGQGYPYNNHTTLIGDQHALTGCVATALGILLQYCQYPAELENGQPSFWGQQVTYKPYDWTKMPKSKPATEEEIEEVSTLLWHIGVNVEMVYGLDKSEARYTNARTFLVDNAQFNKGTRFLNKEDFFWQEWKKMIRETIKGSDGRGYPLVYWGGDHMFIIDGYDPNEYFHVNWGWGGDCNGYFLLTALETERGSYNNGCAMIQGAVPRTVTNEDIVDFRAELFRLDGTITVGTPFTITPIYMNTGSLTETYDFGIGLFDENGDFKKTIHTTEISTKLPNGWYEDTRHTCQIDEELSPTDQIAPIYKLSGSEEWIRMMNAPAAPRYISGSGEAIMDDDTLTDPTVAFQTDLTGLYLLYPANYIVYGGTYRNQIALQNPLGYQLPTNISIIQADGETPWTDYSYDQETGDIVIRNVTTALKLQAKATPNTYPVTLLLDHLTSDSTHDYTVAHEDTLTIKLKADTGYTLPKDVAVSVGGQPLSAYKYEYSYDPTTGVIQIPSVTGAVEISATGVDAATTFKVELNLIHLTTDPQTIDPIPYGESLSIRFIPTEGFGLPYEHELSIYVDDEPLTPIGYTYDYVTGQLTIHRVYGTVKIIAKGYKVEQVANEDKILEGEYSKIEVIATNGNVNLTLDGATSDEMTIHSSEDTTTISVNNNSAIEEIVNNGKVVLTGNATLSVESIINEGEMTISKGLTLSSNEMTVINNGTFIDLTGQVQEVKGEGALAIVKPLLAELSYTSGKTCTLTVSVNVPASSPEPHFEWQKKENGEWVSAQELRMALDSEDENQPIEIEGSVRFSKSYTLPEGEQGSYRCVVTRKYEDGAKKTVLCSETTVTYHELAPDPEPEPEPTPEPDPVPTYRVTLPEVEGAVVESLGSTTVSKGESFQFRIKISEGYTAENLQVKANGIELLPNAAGLYTISSIKDNVVVTITGIVKTVPDAVEGITQDGTILWTSKGQIHIHLAKASTVTVADFAGRVVRQFEGETGDHVIPIQSGQYVVTIGAETYKVVL